MKKIGIAASMAALTMAQVASAQSLHDFENAGRTDMRAMAGVTIPLGNSRNSEETRPRIDFTVESARIGQNANFDHDVRQPAVLGWRAQRKSTLSFTLEQNPSLMFNGKTVATYGPRFHADDEGESGDGGISTGALIGVGAAVLLVGVILIGVDDVQDNFDNLAPDR